MRPAFITDEQNLDQKEGKENRKGIVGAPL